MNATTPPALQTTQTVTPTAAPQARHGQADTQKPAQIPSDTPTNALVAAIATEHETVEADAQRLEGLRKYKQRLGMMRQRNKADPLLGSLIDTQEDKVQEAQTELGKSTGRLTQTSLQLLLANTATAEVHGVHQKALQEQQQSLQQQTDKLKDQAQQLLAQHKIIQQEQALIHTAHRGLMQAHGITKEQALQLVGCVEQVTQAEQRLAAANLQLRTALEHQLQATTQECLDQLNTGFSSLDLRQRSFEEQISSTLSAQSKRTRERLTLFTQASADFEINLSQQLQAHTQAVVDHTATQHAQLVQQQEASAAQLQTFQHGLRQELDATTERNTLALHTTMDGITQTLQTALQAQRAAMESSVQRLHTDMGGIASALQTTDSGLHHTHEAVSALTQQLTQLQAQQRADHRRYLRALAAVASIAIASIAWHLATRYLLM